jgi:hypothetical protein
MYRASSRVLATTTSHIAHRLRPGLSVPHALSSPLQRSFTAVAITPIDGFAEVASSAETAVRDGSKDKPDEEWQQMVEVNAGLPPCVSARCPCHSLSERPSISRSSNSALCSAALCVRNRRVS